MAVFEHKVGLKFKAETLVVLSFAFSSLCILFVRTLM